MPMCRSHGYGENTSAQQGGCSGGLTLLDGVLQLLRLLLVCELRANTRR
jgi:hypothetical protein